MKQVISIFTNGLPLLIETPLRPWYNSRMALKKAKTNMAMRTESCRLRNERHKQMDIVLRPIQKEDLPQAAALWNSVVEAGDSFPGDKILSDAEAWEMFCAQTETVVAVRGGEVAGVYILHPNNIGRCAHIANASFAVKSSERGQGLGRMLVEDCLARAKKNGFRGLQFNAVVATNRAAIALYLKLGFKVLGTVTDGYRDKEGNYRDTLIFLKTI